VHFLVGISEGDGPAAAALADGDGPSLRSVVIAARDTLGKGASYLHSQARGAARALAECRGELVGAEHLLIALIDQARPETLEALRLAGLDPVDARRIAVAALGVTGDLAPVSLPALTPASTQDRPPLPVAELDERVWESRDWRLDHLPLERLRRRSDWDALLHLERAAAWRVASRLGLGENQRYSLTWHHIEPVGQRVGQARPDLVEACPSQAAPSRPDLISSGHRRYRRPRFLDFTIGWGAWFENRQVGIRDGWFRFQTIHYYRGAPAPE
jgi:hypothetical protein